MAFLLPIPIAFILAVAWASWVSRPPKPLQPRQSVEQYRRTLAALAPGKPAVTGDRAKRLAHSR